MFVFRCCAKRTIIAEDNNKLSAGQMSLPFPLRVLVRIIECLSVTVVCCNHTEDIIHIVSGKIQLLCKDKEEEAEDNKQHSKNGITEERDLFFNPFKMILIFPHKNRFDCDILILNYDSVYARGGKYPFTAAYQPNS